MKKFFVKINYSWKYFEADTVKDLLFNIAEYHGITEDELLTIALTNCPEDKLVDMFNRLAPSYYIIEGIWELGNHVFGDEN